MHSSKILLWVTIFSIAMAYLESSVVVYLRMIYYPEGFQFPLKIMQNSTLFIELGREFATVIMLAAIGWISGRNLFERIIYFFFSFGVWDIFYYIWLKVVLNWPASLFEDDILFLIPVPWVGPVLAPIIVSLTFIAAAVQILYVQERGQSFIPDKKVVFLQLSGLVVIFISFIWDAFTVKLLEDPDPGFPWIIFLSGELVLITGIILFSRSPLKAATSK